MDVYTYIYIYIYTCVVAKIAPIGTRTRKVSLESGALPACPFPATDCMSCSVFKFICALRSLYSALKSIPLHMYNEMLANFWREF